MNNKRILSVFFIPAIAFSFCSCGNENNIEQTSNTLSETTNIEVTTEATDEEWTMPEIVTIAEPITDINKIFENVEEGAFVPFQDPERSFCWNQEGYASKILYQNTGSCDTYALSTVLSVNYQINHGKLPYFDPLTLLNRFYCSSDDKDEEKEGAYFVGGSAEDYGSFSLMGDVVALSCDQYDGYLLKDLSVDMRLENDLPLITIDEMKEKIKEHGPVEITVCGATDKAYKGMYTQSSMAQTDHWAVIVGWDDDFPAADYFQTEPSQNGAWLIQNSGSTSWGNNGYAWVTYDYPLYYAVTAEVTEDYSYGISNGNMYTCDVTLRDSDETSGATIIDHEGMLKAVGVYASDSVIDATVTIEIYDGEFGELLASTEGVMDYCGYHVFEFEEPVQVNKYTIVETIKGAPMAFEGSSFSYEDNGVRFDGNNWVEGKFGFVMKTEEGRSFLKAGDEWVDVLSSELENNFKITYPEICRGKNPGDLSVVALYE